jgi:phosphoribosylpyrophosphate synthetase
MTFALKRRVHAHAQGAEAVSAYVTHGVFPRESWRRFMQCNGTPDAFRHFWISDSCPRTVAAVQGQAPFEVLSLAGLIAAALQI